MPSHSFEELLDKDESVTIHTGNLQVATKNFKVCKNLSQTISAAIFCACEIFLIFFIPYLKTVYIGSEGLSNWDPRIWDLVQVHWENYMMPILSDTHPKMATQKLSM